MNKNFKQCVVVQTAYRISIGNYRLSGEEILVRQFFFIILFPKTKWATIHFLNKNNNFFYYKRNFSAPHWCTTFCFFIVKDL